MDETDMIGKNVKVITEEIELDSNTTTHWFKGVFQGSGKIGSREFVQLEWTSEKEKTQRWVPLDLIRGIELI